MSAICPHNKHPGRRATGFTLIEILVVLVIAGLLVGVTLPRLASVYTSVEKASQRRGILDEIEGLGYRAYIGGQPIVLASARQDGKDPPENYPVRLPPGWKLTLSKPLNYSHQGICSGGDMVVTAPDRSEEMFRLKPPLCRLEAADSDAFGGGA